MAGDSLTTDLIHAFRSLCDYGGSVLQHLGNITDSNPNLHKAPVKYEGSDEHEIYLILQLLILAGSQVNNMSMLANQGPLNSNDHIGRITSEQHVHVGKPRPFELKCAAALVEDSHGIIM
ncbi:Uncharacterized protein Fot_38686 [Forsythia ovata]|uniref:Uncharacterized protein n=1 Tax=Forsythia ovata TaxID=205694 RepID=A0ABD1S2H2_9LAMI